MSLQRRITAEIANQGWQDLRIIDWDAIFRLGGESLQHPSIAVVGPVDGVGHVEIFPWREPGEVLHHHEDDGVAVWRPLHGQTVIPIRAMPDPPND